MLIYLNNLRVKIGTFFEHGCVDSDIALLEMKDEIDDSANYACLPHRLMPETYRLLVTFGWGANRSFIYSYH